LKWLDEMAAAGAKRVVLTGGEPTLHKIFLPLVERASKVHQMNVQVQTNAIRFSRTKFAETAREAGVDGLFVSYHSADPDISNTMTRAPGTHAKTVAGIRSALAAGVTVTLNCCVVRDNFESLEDHARSVVDQFVTPFPANPVQLMEYSHAETAFDVQKAKEGSIPFELARPHLHAAIRVLTEAGVATTAIGPCGYPPCLFHGEPDLLQANIIESTFESDQRGRAYAEVCQDCTMKPHCLGVRNEYLSQHGTNGLVAFSEPVDMVLDTGPDVEVGSSRRRLVISSPTQ
jgi:sulfatase maturation enzyme AslB (radical SAM superfamily)